MTKHEIARLGDLTISVTQDHIDRGVRGAADACAIACAVRTVIQNSAPVSVNGDVGKCIAIDVGGWDDPEEVWRLPEDALEWIERFDLGKPVEPITFVAARVEEDCNV